jgi:hypothetical protein
MKKLPETGKEGKEEERRSRLCYYYYYIHVVVSTAGALRAMVTQAWQSKQVKLLPSLPSPLPLPLPLPPPPPPYTTSIPAQKSKPRRYPQRKLR